MQKCFDVTPFTVSLQADQESAGCDCTERLLPDKICDRKFPGELLLNHTSTEQNRLIFENCIFDSVSIKNERASDIGEIRFRNCTIGQIRVFQSEMNLSLENSSVQAVVLESCNISKVRAEASAVQMISLESNSRFAEILLTNESTVEKLDNKDAVIEKIRLHSSKADFIHIHHAIGSLELTEGSSLERFSIDDKDELKRFLDSLRQKQKSVRGGTVSQRGMEYRHQHQILLAAFNQYADDNRFQEMDMCLVQLRKMGCLLSRISTKNVFRQSAYLLEDFVLGKMFGWGVQILNSLITSAAIIVIFAVIHFIVLIDNAESVWSCVQTSLFASVNRFFNANEIDPLPILGEFDTTEQIIGVIILTIFTGVIARKIIR